MPRGGYSPVTNERPAQSPDEEMDQAFESDHEDSDSTPLTHPSASSPERRTPQPSRQSSFGYDFEREYDHPPPGSPPQQPSILSHAMGNTNGVMPDPLNVERPTSSPWRPSFFRRAVGVLLPQHYTQVPTSDAPEVRGSGVENDGVFSNVLARPSRPTTTRTANGNGEIQEAPEFAQKEVPPVRMRLAPPDPHTPLITPFFGLVWSEL